MNNVYIFNGNITKDTIINRDKIEFGIVEGNVVDLHMAHNIVKLQVNATTYDANKINDICKSILRDIMEVDNASLENTLCKLGNDGGSISAYYVLRWDG